jgi:hypothetical protein
MLPLNKEYCCRPMPGLWGAARMLADIFLNQLTVATGRKRSLTQNV